MLQTVKLVLIYQNHRVQEPRQLGEKFVGLVGDAIFNLMGKQKQIGFFNKISLKDSWIGRTTF